MAQALGSMGLIDPVQPWDKIDWSFEIKRGIFKDWGVYYSRRGRETSAMSCFDKALELGHEDFITLFHRSQTKRKRAQIEGALADSKAAAELASNAGYKNAPINLNTCDALRELNQFENCKVELHDNTRNFTGNKTKAFERSLIVTDENIKDATDESLGPFILENENVISQVLALNKAKNRSEIRPLWKILKEEGKCDVLSILEAEHECLSPLEEARRKRAFDLFNQNYLNESWIDVLFLKYLRKNPNLLLPQCRDSSPYLRALTSEPYEVVKKFLKMLQARMPMYYIRYNKYLNKKMFEKYRQDFLFRIQYQTRRNMNSVLRSIHNLRSSGNIKKLSRYVEETMGDYVVLKTHRIMPWKFEFLNEVYNTLAVAYAEQYKVPSNLNMSDKKALLRLLRLPTDKAKDFVPFIFGDRSTHQEPDLLEPSTVRARHLLTRLDKRMIFAKYSIEKCYLLHQMGQTHLGQNHFDECCFLARKAMEETKNCNSNLWRFLSCLLVVKAHAALHKIERVKEAMSAALEISLNLKCPRLTHFIETCILCNDEEIMKKHSMSSNPSVSASRRQSKSSNITTPSIIEVRED